MTYEELKSDKIIRRSQDKNKEWILLFLTIYTVIYIIPSALIYQRKSDNLKNT